MLLCLALVGCSSVVDEEPEVVERVKVGDHVPSFTIDITIPKASPEEAGHSIFSTDHLTGETVIVFFNTWCGDCKRELPKLNDYYLQHKDNEGFQMVAISRAEDDATVSAFWSANNLMIPYSAQTDRNIYELFATSIVPRIYFISSKGIITRIEVDS